MERPTTLTVICVIGIVLASLGGLGGLCGLTSGVMQLSGVPMGVEADVLEFQRKWLPASMTILIAKMVVVGLLFYGTMSALRLAAHGRKWLNIAMWAGLIFEIGQIYPIVSMQLHMFELMKDDMLRQQPPGGPLSPDQFLEIVKGMTIAIGVGFALLKAGYYSWGIMYTSFDSTRELFEGRTGDNDNTRDKRNRDSTNSNDREDRHNISQELDDPYDS